MDWWRLPGGHACGWLHKNVFQRSRRVSWVHSMKSHCCKFQLAWLAGTVSRWARSLHAQRDGERLFGAFGIRQLLDACLVNPRCRGGGPMAGALRSVLATQRFFDCKQKSEYFWRILKNMKNATSSAFDFLFFEKHVDIFDFLKDFTFSKIYFRFLFFNSEIHF